MATMWCSGRGMMTGLSQLLQRALDAGSGVSNVTSIQQIMGSTNNRLPSLRSLSSVPFSRGFATGGEHSAAGPPDGHYVTLNTISDNPGATKTVGPYSSLILTFESILFGSAH